MSLLTVALRGCCPRCEGGSLFSGFLRLRDRCPHCGLDFSGEDIGDGPAFFIGFFALIVVALVFFWLEVTYRPPIWLHVVVAGVIGSGVSLPLMRPTRALFLAIQYRQKLLLPDHDG